MHKLMMTTIAGLSMVTAGCQSMTPAQRNAAVGAAVGAAAGTAVANDDTEGALAGAAVGAAVGYYTGCRQQGGCYVGGDRVASQTYYDQRADRRYFVDESTGNTYWANGDLRSRG